jgi:hypothetical protein
MPLKTLEKRPNEIFSVQNNTPSFNLNQRQCKVLQQLYDGMNCRSPNKFTRMFCGTMNTMLKGCTPTQPPQPSDPCEGISCAPHQECQSGLCVDVCKPSGNSCVSNGDCCSFSCNDGFCE